MLRSTGIPTIWSRNPSELKKVPQEASRCVRRAFLRSLPATFKFSSMQHRFLIDFCSIWGTKSTRKSWKNRSISLSKRLRDTVYNSAQISHDFLTFFNENFKVNPHCETTSIERRSASARKPRTFENSDFSL